MSELMLNYAGWGVPDHTAETIENYLIRGYHPGGFVSSVLSNDLFGACTSCDHINKQAIVDIVKWVACMVPSASWGSRQAIADWIEDKDGLRTKYASDIEKRFIWDKLNQK